MVKKEIKKTKLKETDKKLELIKKTKKEEPKKKIKTLLRTNRDIAMDFAGKVFGRFDKLIKSVVLFGSNAKHTNITGSDIDIIIIVDDAIVKFDEKMILWYRDELRKLIKNNPYKKELHINTVKLSTWWYDLFKGDPVAINILRYGESLIDSGFFTPLKVLLEQGKIKPTPESIYIILNRIPIHIVKSRQAEMSAIEGCYWAFVESAQALLMSINILPPSPEHIPLLLKENFVDKKLLKMKYVTTYRDLYDLHRRIIHGEIKNLDGKIIDEFQELSEDFFKETLRLIEETLD